MKCAYCGNDAEVGVHNDESNRTRLLCNPCAMTYENQIIEAGGVATRHPLKVKA